MSPLTIRLGTAEDAPTFAAIHAAAFERPWSADEIRALTGHAPGFALAAERADGCVGFCLAWAPADDAEILTIAVHPQARRNGAGRGLIAGAMAHARAVGARTMALEVNDANAPAIALYASLGFTEVGRRKGYYDAGAGTARDALVLKRTLLDT
ncbi:MAG: ribosomal protein S18-alanine N-acetyltransferase [Caulobacterales bacterium]